MNVITRFVLDHKRLVLGLWLVVTIAAFAAIQPAGNALSQQFSVPGREGFETNQELGAIYGNGGDVAPIVPVVTLPKGKTVDSPGITRQLDAALARVEAALPDARTASYASTGDRAFISDHGRTTFALSTSRQRVASLPAKPRRGGRRRRWRVSRSAVRPSR